MQSIETRYYGPGNVRGARIRAKASGGFTLWIDYEPASQNPHRDAAVALCKKLGWHGTLCEGGIKRGSVFVFCDRDDDKVSI